jgi:hypothetical protein
VQATMHITMDETIMGLMPYGTALIVKFFLCNFLLHEQVIELDWRARHAFCYDCPITRSLRIRD